MNQDIVQGHQGKLWRLNVRAYVWDQKSHLLLVRIPRHQGPDWELPGGGIQVEESASEALRRELHEETGLTELSKIKAIEALKWEIFDPTIVTKLRLAFDGLLVQEFLVWTDTLKPTIDPIDGEVGESGWFTVDEARARLDYKSQGSSFE